MSTIFDQTPGKEDGPNLEEINTEVLVGDGRKYASTDDLAKAYVHADSFIEKQKARIAELETEVRIREELANKQKTPPEEKPGNEPGHENPPVTPPVNTPEGKSDVDIASLVRNELEKASTEKTFAQNVDSAAKVLVEVYGSEEKANLAVRQKAAELGVGVDWLMNIAGTSPSALLGTMGVSPETKSTSTPFSSSEVVRNRGASKKNFKYFEEIRKADPKSYYSAQVRKEMFEARKELGDAFYSN